MSLPLRGALARARSASKGQQTPLLALRACARCGLFAQVDRGRGERLAGTTGLSPQERGMNSFLRSSPWGGGGRTIEAIPPSGRDRPKNTRKLSPPRQARREPEKLRTFAWPQTSSPPTL